MVVGGGREWRVAHVHRNSWLCTVSADRSGSGITHTATWDGRDIGGGRGLGLSLVLDLSECFSEIWGQHTRVSLKTEKLQNGTGTSR